jgi:alanyl-tRNA synthetase
MDKQTPHSVAEIRKAFLDFFGQNGHAVVASHSLLPPADPTLLFINAGMVQFKDYFTGARVAPYKTATSTQKCLRVSGKHNDLENVGRTRRHHTLFEMLGNFSFGDYFKEGAITYAWTFLTDVLKLDQSRLVTTYFAGNAQVPADLEARDLWQKIAGLPVDRIVPLGEKDNFWAMGDTGPCGPCTEIYWDLDPSQGPECTLAKDDGRYIEIWNCVFMQYDRQDGKLSPLPAPSVDTGMGLERVASVKQGAQSNYDTDLFLGLIETMERLSGVKYGGLFDPENVVSHTPDIERDVAFRVIADHARATAFLIAEGIYPDSEGRGYVLRRIMRRAIRFGRKLGMTQLFFAEIASQVADMLGDVFPELQAARPIILRVTRTEEERFGQTLESGLRLIDAEMARIDATGGEKILPGAVVFLLHDTNGFPTDLTALIAAERGYAVDLAGFEAAMQAQKARGKASWKKAAADWQAAAKLVADAGYVTNFVGYDGDRGDGKVLAILGDDAALEDAPMGTEAWLILDQTPFYGEGGGQVGDRGVLYWSEGGRAAVLDTQKTATGLYLHKIIVEMGTLWPGENVLCEVDGERRASVRAHHSATHLLHKALRDVLGEHVKQRGSLVQVGRLRFDFSHYASLTDEEIQKVEAHANARVFRNEAADVAQTSMDDAVARGALAFFGDKYGEVVRVMKLADSVELCGGTHVGRTGDIGLIKIVSETAVSAGVRRVEAVCREAALQHVQEGLAALEHVSRRLNVTQEQLPERIEKLAEQVKSARDEAEKWKHKALSGSTGGGLNQEQKFGSHTAVFRVVDGAEGAGLRTLADQARDQVGSGVVCLLSTLADGKALLLVAVTADLTAKLPAGQTVAALAPLLGGRGGGRPDFAQAGGKAPEDVAAVAAAFFAKVGEALA